MLSKTGVIIGGKDGWGTTDEEEPMDDESRRCTIGVDVEEGRDTDSELRPSESLATTACSGDEEAPRLMMGLDLSLKP